MNNGLDSATLKQLSLVFSGFPALERVSLFGSRAKGTQRSGSDIDLAVSGLHNSEIVRLSMCLNEETDLPYFFDVIDVDSISNQDLLDHIERAGKVIYDGRDVCR